MKGILLTGLTEGVCSISHDEYVYTNIYIYIKYTPSGLWLPLLYVDGDFGIGRTCLLGLKINVILRARHLQLFSTFYPMKSVYWHFLLSELLNLGRLLL